MVVAKRKAGADAHHTDSRWGVEEEYSELI